MELEHGMDPDNTRSTCSVKSNYKVSFNTQYIISSETNDNVRLLYMNWRGYGYEKAYFTYYRYDN